jgi:hypothetical protein
MQDNSAKSRDFNPLSIAGLSDEARQAVNAAFDAMSAWRTDIANSNEKNSEQVIEKMAAAAVRWDGRSKSSTPPTRSFRASPKCRSK